MNTLNVIWEDDALKLLEGRDRYTRNAIREEFRRDPTKDAVLIDADAHEYLTPVSDDRFTVLWCLNEERGQAVVRAVLPLTNVSLKQTALGTPDAMKQLKEYVVRAVAAETKNF